MDKQTILENIAIVGVGILIGIILYNVSAWSVKQNHKDFYNGCECGGHWEFQQVVGHQVSTSYIYKCNKCGNLLETNTFYNTEREEN